MLGFDPEKKILSAADSGDLLNSLITPQTDRKQEFLDKVVKPTEYGDPIYLSMKEVNGWLNKNGIHTLPERYFSDENQFKIVGICPDKIDRHGNFYMKIPFQVQLPNGKEFCYPALVNCNSVISFGIAYIPIIDGKILLVKQGRMGAGKDLWELPRGFPELEPSDKTIYLEGAGNVNAGLSLRELGEEVYQNITPDDVELTYLGCIYENSSTSLNSFDCVISHFKGIIIPDGGLEGLKCGLFDLGRIDVMKNITHEICDAHTLSSLSMFESFLRENNPELKEAYAKALLTL